MGWFGLWVPDPTWLEHSQLARDIVLCLGSFVPALAIAVAVYPLLVRLSKRRGGEVFLKGDRLR